MTRRTDIKYAAGVERLFDIVVSAGALLVLSPLVVVISSALWLESGFPIYFSQTRLGKNGRLFRIHKFRKFAGDCGIEGCGVSVKGDRRLTAVGALLEKSKLNELPQLWNILKGDMAIVGPRPESQRFAGCFSGRYAHLLRFTPGIFGPNQYYFRDEGSLYPHAVDPEQFYRDVLFPLKANIDLAYFENRTLLEDIGWFVRGVLAVVGVRSMPDRKFEAKLTGWLDRDRSRSIGTDTPHLCK